MSLRMRQWSSIPRSAEADTYVVEKRAPLPPLPAKELDFERDRPRPSIWDAWTRFSILPWKRIPAESVLAFKLAGKIHEVRQPSLSNPTPSLGAIARAIRNAADDSRVKGIAVRIDPLKVGWATLQELRRNVEYFRESGKFSIAYMERATEKEYYLASAFEEVYCPPTALLLIRGFSVSSLFLRGALDKLGIEPEVRRIGKYKSAGDQLLRKDMSEAQREQMMALLDGVEQTFVNDVAKSRNKTPEEVRALIERGLLTADQFGTDGWLSGLQYEDQVEDLLKQRTGGRADRVRRASLWPLAAIRRSPGWSDVHGGKAVAVIRAQGPVLPGEVQVPGPTIQSSDIIRQLRAVGENKRIAAVVLRIDSPGGDAVASDVIWREVQLLRRKKPVVASLANVAASGGYYIAMAASYIVAEPLSITGSIGVVLNRLCAAPLLDKLGLHNQTLSIGKFANALSLTVPPTPEDGKWLDDAAQGFYKVFRDKAAASRGMTVEAMQEVAQGRVWSGEDAAAKGLVDAVGGFRRAVQLAQAAAGLPAEAPPVLLEITRPKGLLSRFLDGGGSNPLLRLPLASWAARVVAGAQAEQVAGALELAMQVPAGAALAVSSVDDVHGGAGPDPATSARQQGVDWL